MAKTLFLLVCLVIGLARTSYAGLLENYFRHSNDERVDCRRGDEREDDAEGPPQFYLSLKPAGERLAYGQNPEYKYKRVSFAPRGVIGNSLLPFYLPLCSDYSLQPAVVIEGKEQELYVDSVLQLYMEIRTSKTVNTKKSI
ncbi:Hypothetical predicted protein [Paramuricea clavata]|uniref:Uncharacterized protein n=1 Tax=Paramuricea clavata TaxID=317549 RepID=A0A6S7J1E0_PARCT|nr:Hypothetical predicted protein [Paramuricea clavata]